MLGLYFLRLASTEGRFRVNEFLWTESTSAFLTLIAIGIGISAFRTSTCNIAICKKDFSFRIKILLCRVFSSVVNLRPAIEDANNSEYKSS